MNLQDKKTKQYIVGATIVVAIAIGIFTSSQINFVRNAQVNVTSTLSNLKQNILEQKELLLEIEKDVKETKLEEAKFLQIKSKMKKIEDADCFDDSKINENVAMFDNFNKELDEMITLYNNSAVDEDILLVNKREEVKLLNNFIDEMMFEYNKDYLPEFNKRIATFPASIYANIKDWYKVNEFKSIDMDK